MTDNTATSKGNHNHGQSVPVVLPCSVDAFRDFVAGLLGSPQEIEGGQFGAFSIGHNEIEQTYYLVTQRVFQQHGVNPISFAVRIVYDDGTSIQLNSFDDFKSFHEPKPVVSTECHIVISYLIKFPISPAPEKQDISISFISSKFSKSNRFPLATFAEGSELFARGYINYRIKYTARTWGADIEGLLKSHIEHLIEKEPKIRCFMRKHSVAAGLITGGVAFALAFYSQSIISERAIIEQLNGINGILGKTVTTNDKLDSIIQMLVSGTATRISELSSRFITIGALASLLLAIFVENKSDRRKPSFVLLTKRATDEQKISLKTYEKSWVSLWISILGGITLGVCSNFIYDHFAKEAIAEVMKGPLIANHINQPTANNSSGQK